MGYRLLLLKFLAPKAVKQLEPFNRDPHTYAGAPQVRFGPVMAMQQLNLVW